MNGIASVTVLNLDSLKSKLVKDKSKLLNLWRAIAHRMIVFNHDKLPMFMTLPRDKIVMFTKMCDFKMYTPGELVNLSSGAVIFRGKVTNLKQEEDSPVKFP
jgi:hypothetical protein